MSDRWQGLNRIHGVHVFSSLDDDYPEAPGKYDQPWAHLRSENLTPDHRSRYGRQNDSLHDAIERTIQQHFAEIEPPDILLNDGCGSPTPFAYQVRDWYAPTYECHVVVYEDFVNCRLLAELQGKLTGDHRNWCIVLNTTQSPDFDTNNEILVFAEDVFIPVESFGDLGIADTDLPSAPPPTGA